MSDKKNPTPTADPPKPMSLSLLERALALCDPQLGEAELLDWIRMGGTPESFIPAKSRVRADAERQRQIDRQPEPEKADPARVADVLARMKRGRDCSPFFLGGVEWKSLEKRFSNTWEGSCPDDNGRNVKCILGVLEGGTPVDRAVREARDEAPEHRRHLPQERFAVCTHHAERMPRRAGRVAPQCRGRPEGRGAPRSDRTSGT